MNILERETSLGLKMFSLENKNFVYKRIADASSFHNNLGVRQPGDFDGIYCGKPFIIECKSTKKTRFYFSNIREHQYDDMIEYFLAGANAWFLISYRNTRDIKYLAMPVMDLFNMITTPAIETGNIPASFSYSEAVDTYKTGIPLYIKHDDKRNRYIDITPILSPLRIVDNKE
jgi:penicillin-binding protein-related factor A (putative recombinase)